MAAAAIPQEKQKLLDLIQQRPQALGVAGSRWAGVGGVLGVGCKGVGAATVCGFIFFFFFSSSPASEQNGLTRRAFVWAGWI